MAEMERQPQKSYWLRIAEGLAVAAEKARQAGDVHASLELAMVSAQYLQVARNLDRAGAYLTPSPPKE